MIKNCLLRQVRARVLGAVLLLPALAPGAACASMTDTLNKLRAQACEARQPLHANARLDQVAQRLAQGTQLQAAERQAGYHAAKILALEVSGVSDEQSLVRILGQERCAQLDAPGIRELGTYSQASHVWIVLAEPFRTPDTRNSYAITRRVLELTNAARSKPHSCGATLFPAAPPLTLNPQLLQAALTHSRDMATHGYMDHRARDGSSPGVRVSRAGYHWRVVGENLATGVSSADEVVSGWLGSPHHCANLMDAEYTHMGIAFAVNLDSPGGVYWTQLFGAPR